MENTSKLSIGVLASLATGSLMVEPFSEYHKGISALMGDCNTGMIPSLIPFAQEDIIKQYPFLEDVSKINVTAENYKRIVIGLSISYGETFNVTRISEERFEEIKQILKQR